MKRKGRNVSRQSASKMARSFGIHTSLGATTWKDLQGVLLVTLVVGIAVWGITEPLENGTNRCASCPVGGTVWMLNETDYVLIPDQLTMAGIGGVALGLLFPLRRRYADGPVICGVKTRHRRHYRLPSVSPIAMIQRGWPANPERRIALFVLMFVALTVTMTSSFLVGAMHTTHETYGNMKRWRDKGPLFGPALGACQGLHCVGCLSARQWALSRALRMRTT